MNCLDVRRALGADPAARPVALTAHLAECPACARHAQELARLDGLIYRALSLPSRAAVVAPVVHARRPRWFALAAGLAATALLVVLSWTLSPQPALATALVAHMAHEPDSRLRTTFAAPPAAVGYVLGRAGVALESGAAEVSYVHSCLFRGWFVPHLVVQTPAGPMTVMVLTHERVLVAMHFDEGGYRGVIVPAQRGAFAVLAPAGTDAAAIDALVARLASAVRYIG